MNYARTISDRPLRLLEWMAISLLSTMMALMVVSAILDGFILETWRSLLLAAVTLSIMPTLVWPVLYRLTARLPAILFPIVVFVGSGALVKATAWVDTASGFDGFSVDSVLNGIWIAMSITIVTTFVSALFSLDDDAAFDRFVTKSLKYEYRNVERSDIPAFIFLEADGLAAPVLEDAVSKGYMPTLKRWIETGTHRLTTWEPDLSCQTSASQAGILLGSNENIPAFRWWDKQRQTMMTSSKLETAKALEEELSAGVGLLEPDGGSRFNVFSGGAGSCIGTFSKLGASAAAVEYWPKFLNPFTLARLLSLFVQDVVREWWEEFQQNRRDVQPRLSRPWTYAFVRAGTTAALLEITRLMVIIDIFKGVPSAYYSIYAYDEVAHHTGINRHYTYKVLKQMDRAFGHFERVARDAPRPVHFVILSDHGQSQGATFLQRYGTALGAFVASLLPTETSLTAIHDTAETTSQWEALLSQAASTESRTGKLVARTFRKRTVDGVVTLGNEQSEREITQDEVVVLASGNLGLISFTRWMDRMTFQEIVTAFPGLIRGLRDHPGIALVMVRDDEEGAVVFGKKGTYFLDTDSFDGENPLESFGDLAAHHLRRTDGFPACPDILLISTYWPETGEVTAFEEKLGSHGGLGGLQRQPMILHPAEFSVGNELIVGAGELNRVLRGWMSDARIHGSGNVAAPDSEELSPPVSALPASA
ncbi:phage holin family protein [soil metagenome]